MSEGFLNAVLQDAPSPKKVNDVSRPEARKDEAFGFRPQLAPAPASAVASIVVTEAGSDGEFQTEPLLFSKLDSHADGELTEGSKRYQCLSRFLPEQQDWG